MTIIEKVARAICENDRVNPDAFITHDGDRAWMAYRSYARAAIEAIAANVSEEMCMVAIKRSYASDVNFGEAVIDSYRDAIAAALRCAGEGR